MSNKIALQDHCKECGGKIITTLEGRICADCGLVQGDDAFISTDDWFPNHEIKNPLHLGFKGTTFRPVDSKSKTGSHRDNKFYKLKRIQATVSTSENESDYRTIKIINKILNKLSFPRKYREFVIMKYHQFRRRYRKKKINTVTLSVMAMLQVIEENHNLVPLTWREVINAYKEEGHKINNRIVLKAFISTKRKVKILPSQKSVNYLRRIITKLQEQERLINEIKKKLEIYPTKYFLILEKDAKKILEDLPDQLKIGKRPFILAIAAVHVASEYICLERLSRNILKYTRLGRIFNVSYYTIREHAIQIKEFIENKYKSQEGGKYHS